MVLVAVCCSLPAYANEKEPSNVLVMYSHHYNFQWVEELQKGLNDALSDENLYFYNEYLNEHQLAGTVDFADIFTSLDVKFKHVDFDCIVVADNYAYNFLAEYYEKLSPGTPVVFVAVNGYSDSIAFTDKITGIPQNTDMGSLIRLILSINDQDELLFVSSENATSIAEIQSARNIIEEDFPNLQYRILTGTTLDEILDKLAGVAHAQLIMIGNIIQEDGSVLPPEELLSKLFETTNLPIYTTNRLQISDKPSGAIGGVVVEPYVHAYEAGLMVKQILNGVDVHTIPVRSEALTTYVFNYSMLEYFKIDEQILPKGSILLGKKNIRIAISPEEAISLGTIALLLFLFLIVMFMKAQQLKQEVRKSREIQKELRASNDKFQAYIQLSPVGIFVTDTTGRYIEVNQKACQMTGYREKDLLKLSIKDYLLSEESMKGMKAFNRILDTGFAEGDFKVRKKDGKENWISLTGAKINGNKIIAFCTDITERKERDSRIEYLNFNDSITKVHNRAFFEEELKRLDAEEYLPLSYIISDTNGLKMVNDTLGHAAGDIVLIETAKVLQRNTRKDDVLARVGGDEFALLLPKTDSSEAQAIMEHIRLECLDTIVNVNRQEIELSISMGHATKTESPEPISQVLKIAEDFMYRRKLLERTSLHSSFFNSLRKSLFERSQETDEHAERLVAMTRKVGKSLGFQESQLNELQLLSTMHDLGKISIDNKILTKPGKLTEIEWLEMKKHPSIGYRIAMTSPDLKPIADYILCHHERWDGKGYPQGLCGESIPLLSRILAVSDAYDAMTTDRPYRKALTKEVAFAEIEKNSGTQFDPEIVKIFLEEMQEFDS
jgi:diguanylate cyclase (GGDEF)-like protein/PAS domain S-box-containing protein